MRVDAAVERRELAAENIADQVFSTDCGAGCVEQCREQIEFYGGEVDRCAASPHGASAAVEGDVAERDSTEGRSPGCGSSEDGADAREQFGGVEGLGEIIVGAQFEAANAVLR